MTRPDGTIVATTNLTDAQCSAACSWLRTASKSWDLKDISVQLTHEGTPGGPADALFIDSALLDMRTDADAAFEEDVSVKKLRYGRNGGKGWCLSSDPTDEFDDWNEYVDGCYRCLIFKNGDARPCPPEPTDATITPTKDVYAPGEMISVGFSGFPGNQKDWVAIAYV